MHFCKLFTLYFYYLRIYLVLHITPRQSYLKTVEILISGSDFLPDCLQKQIVSSARLWTGQIGMNLK